MCQFYSEDAYVSWPLHPERYLFSKSLAQFIPLFAVLPRSVRTWSRDNPHSQLFVSTENIM